jgi:predicted glycoside hydrolase/deacetylase ChbG (UPF0249 family)
MAQTYRLPLREHSPVRYISSFYGQWDGETHMDHIGAQSLIRMLETEIGDGITELGCHPGYYDPHFESSYHREREIELQTLCEPKIKDKIAELGIKLISYQDLERIFLYESDQIKKIV